MEADIIGYVPSTCGALLSAAGRSPGTKKKERKTNSKSRGRPVSLSLSGPLGRSLEGGKESTVVVFVSYSLFLSLSVRVVERVGFGRPGPNGRPLASPPCCVTRKGRRRQLED